MYRTSKLLILINLIAISFFAFSGYVSAEESATDDVNVSVPISCTLSGTGMNSHTATIPNGTTNSSIGETTLKAYCNDTEGFAIYAIGYTNNTDGKNVLTDSALGPTHDIATGTLTSGANSQWAMKLSTVTNPAPAYPLIIENDFNNFHIIPSDYIRVAKRTSATDTGENAEGSTLKSTYQAFISPTQSAGTYNGKVKYVLTHPNYADTSALSDAITVVYHSSDLSFPDGSKTNTVKYANVCRSGGTGYVGNTYQEIMTSNILTGGTQNGAYTNNEYVEERITLPDADRVKVVIKYGITADTLSAEISGEFDNEDNPGVVRVIQDFENDASGTKTYVFDGDTVNFYIQSWGTPGTNNNYGFYIKVYPVYNTEQSNTTPEELPSSDCFFTTLSGTYLETNPWRDAWYRIMPNGVRGYYDNESDLFNNYLPFPSNTGSTIDLYAYEPYSIKYDGNGATRGTMDGFTTTTTIPNGSTFLMAPNFYRNGYGFAGWSPDKNASVNGNSTIYGPNEQISVSNLSFDNDKFTTLYAIWVPSAGTLQNWSGCSSLGSGQVTALTDSRDNNTYAVSKLADGNCWMIENLKLDAAHSSDATKAQGFGGVFTGLADSEDDHFKNDSTANSKYTSSAINSTGGTSWVGYRFPRYNNNNTNIGGTNSLGTTLITAPGYFNAKRDSDDITDMFYQKEIGSWANNSQWYSYGNYYSRAAAMANTIYFSDYNQSELADTSICPKGWSLPYGRNAGNGVTKGGYSYLDTQLGGNGNAQQTTTATARWLKYPNNFIFSGYWYENSGAHRGWRGYYASRTSSYSNFYSLELWWNKVSPGTSITNYAAHGVTVRCLTP